MAPKTMAFRFLWILTALIFQSKASADPVVTTPFEIDLTPASAQLLLGSSSFFNSPSGEMQSTLPDMTITDPYQVSIQGISLDLKYAFQKPVSTGAMNEWSLQSQSIAAEVVVQKIDASQVIHEQSGGISFDVTIQASCTNVHMVLPAGSTIASGKIDLVFQNGKPNFQLADFSANWAPSSWKVTSIQCTGPDGFAALVQAAAEKQLSSINPFLGAIRDQLQQQLSSFSGSLEWDMAGGDASSGLSMKMKPTGLSIASDGTAAVSGLLSVTFENADPSACGADLSGAPLPPSTGKGDDSLRIPQAAIQPLVTCAHQNGSLIYPFTQQQFPAFQTLVASPLLETIAWPDLARFSSKDPFQFYLFPIMDPSIGALTQDANRILHSTLDAPLSVSIFAPISGLLTHYVDFITRVQGQVTLSVQNGVLHLQQNNASVPLQVYWDMFYIQKYSPDRRIWTSKIQGYLQQMLNSPGISYNLPSWQVPQQFKLTFQNLAVEGSDLRLKLGIQSLR